MAKKLISNRQIKTYQNTIDGLRESLGRSVTIYVGSGIPSANWDPINNEPVDPDESITYDWTTYVVEKALVRWLGPEDYVVTPGGRVEVADVKVKCKLNDVLASGSDPNNNTWFDLCSQVEIDGQICKVKGKPKKTGLRDLYMVEVLLERTNL